MKSTRIAALALAMTGVVCILLGCGNPTTANYIIMVTVAAPTLVLLGVEPLVAHFFVFLVPAGRAADDRARADAHVRRRAAGRTDAGTAVRCASTVGGAGVALRAASLHWISKRGW